MLSNLDNGKVRSLMEYRWALGEPKLPDSPTRMTTSTKSWRVRVSQLLTHPLAAVGRKNKAR